jgi:hypothetical protein
VQARVACIVVSGMLAAFSSSGCNVSRCASPRLTGCVYDASTRLPLANCEVRHAWSSGPDNVTRTRPDGSYELGEKRYRQWTWIAMEAPPMRINLLYSMPGYEAHEVNHFDQYGGSTERGHHQQMAPVFLTPSG